MNDSTADENICNCKNCPYKVTGWNKIMAVAKLAVAIYLIIMIVLGLNGIAVMHPGFIILFIVGTAWWLGSAASDLKIINNN